VFMRLVKLTLLLILFAADSAVAQQITIKLINGRNGRPMKNVVIDVWFGERASGAPLQVKTRQDGTVVVTIPGNEKSVVAAGEWVADCRGGNKPGNGFIDSNVYSVTQVSHTGIVAQNSCGTATQQPIPGTLALFVRPTHWWEKMRE
jgi:hypothetical protein